MCGQVVIQGKIGQFVREFALSVYFLVDGEGWMAGIGSKTLAARPVGASSTTFCFNWSMVRTMAAISEVFPVPAYPFRMNAESGSGESMNCASFSKAALCSGVGQWGKWAFICFSKKVFIIIATEKTGNVPFNSLFYSTFVVRI